MGKEGLLLFYTVESRSVESCCEDDEGENDDKDRDYFTVEHGFKERERHRGMDELVVEVKIYVEGYLFMLKRFF